MKKIAILPLVLAAMIPSFSFAQSTGIAECDKFISTVQMLSSTVDSNSLTEQLNQGVEILTTEIKDADDAQKVEIAKACEQGISELSKLLLNNSK